MQRRHYCLAKQDETVRGGPVNDTGVFRGCRANSAGGDYEGYAVAASLRYSDFRCGLVHGELGRVFAAHMPGAEFKAVGFENRVNHWSPVLELPQPGALVRKPDRS